jgi:3-hydroxybutyryl-CoA dehydrogenase
LYKQPDDLVAVVGADAMGTGISQVALLAGHRVLLLTRRAESSRRGREEIESRILRLVDKGRLGKEEALAALDRLTTSEELPEAASAGLVMESEHEDMAAKSALLADIEKHVGEEVVIATNTSSLSVTALAAGLENPARFAGPHFFNPAPLMALAEVVSAPSTAERTTRFLHRTAERWGKTPVLVGDPHRNKEVSALLLGDHGIHVQPVNAPTVPEGTERLRVTPTSRHTAEDVRAFVEALDAVWSAAGLPRSR